MSCSKYEGLRDGSYMLMMNCSKYKGLCDGSYMLMMI